MARTIRIGAIGLLLAFGCGAPPSVLRLGRSLTGHISPGESRRFSVHLRAGQYALILVDQRDGDLALNVSGPGITRTRSVDEFEFGPECASILAPRSGTYSVAITIVGRPGAGAEFNITLAEVRAARASDSDEQRAEDLATNAKVEASSGPLAAPAHALDLNRQALTLWQTLRQERAIAGTRLKIGEVLYSTSDLVGAQNEFLNARQTCEVLRDRRCTAEAANNAGLCAWRLSKNDEAFSMLKEALELWTTLRIPYGQAATNNNLGLLSWQTGEWQDAISYHLRAIDLFGRRFARETALTENNLGLDYMSLGDFARAVQYLQNAAAYFHRSSEFVAEGRTLMNIGRARMFEGDLETASTLQREALGLLENSSNLSYRADALNNVGQVLLKQSVLKDAEISLRKAFEVYVSTSDPRGQASALHHLGITIASRGDVQTGLTYLHRALDIREQRNLNDDAAETLFQMARLQRSAGRVHEAVRSLHRAIDLSESLRTRATGLYFRSSYFATKQTYYEAYVDLLMSLHKGSPYAGYDRQAFAVSERSRSRSLMDSLGEAQAGIRVGVDQELLKRERSIARQIGLLSNALVSINVNQVRVGSEGPLREELDNHLREYEQLEALLRQSSPAYSALVIPQPLSVQAIQSALLDSDTLLLEFFLGDHSSYAWAVSHNSLKAYVLPGRTVLEKAIRSVRELLEVQPPAEIRESRRQRMQPTLRILARELFSSVDDLPRYRRIAIVADGLLQFAPFAALPIGPTGVPRPSTTPLGLTHEIVMLPSASSVARLRQIRSGRALPPKTIALFADPVFDSHDPRVQAAPATSALKTSADSSPVGLKLPRLPFSRFDVASVEKWVGPNNRLVAADFAANRETLFSEEMQEFRIIHLSTHAIIDEKTPTLSGVALSMVDRQGQRLDGFVRLTDIYNLPTIRAQLVVLSACRTGLGQQVRGEGAISLSRAFLYAGASQVIVSLWNVDDEASAEFMRYFYEAVLGPKKQSASAALRTAESAMYATKRWTKDPSYWAGFVLQGDWK